MNGFDRRLAHLIAVIVCAATAAPLADRVPARPGPDQGVAASIDALLSSLYAPDGPGAAVVVVKDGQVLLRKGYGLANVELGVPMRPDMVMALASLTKPFTAAAILKLAEQGRLSLDDPVTKFLPGFASHGAAITIEHLLTHTSGINALEDTPDLRASATDGQVTDVLGTWVKALPPDAAPGERWAYLNWGYSLLGAIVERASGQTYAEFLHQAFFDPLGMRQTRYADRRRIVPLRATGYGQAGGVLVNAVPSASRLFHPAAAGGLLSTVDDLARWNAALEDARVLSRASIERMFTSYRLKDGTATGYGYGWDIGEYEGHRVQEHAGGTTGFQSFMVRLPDDRAFVAILSNVQSADVPLQATAHRVAALALGRPLPETVPVPVAAALLDGLAGTYRGPELGTFSVSHRADRVVAQVGGLGEVVLVPVAPQTFRSARVTWTFTFEVGPDLRATHVLVTDWKLHDLATRVELPSMQVPVFVHLRARALDACVGEYQSIDGTLVRVDRVADHLVARPATEPGVELFPTSAAEFWTKPASGRYVFVRDHGVVTGLLRANGGGRGIPARRLGATRPFVVPPGVPPQA